MLNNTYNKMDKKQKLWTIIINCYNSTKTIRHTLNSINLKEEGVDVFVIDDGSKDNLKKVIAPLLKSYPNTIHYFKKTNSGWGGCINFACKYIKSKYVSILDSDDSYNTKSFNQIISIMKRITIEPDIFRVNHCFKFLFTGKTTKKKVSRTFKEIKYYEYEKINLPFVITIHSCIFKTEIFKKIKKLPCNIAYTDTILIYQILQKVKIIAYLNRNIFLYNYFIHNGTQSISTETCIKNFYQFDIVFKYLLDCPTSKNESKKRIISSANIIKYWILWIMKITSLNYNMKNKAKVKKINYYLSLLKNFLNNNPHYKFAFKTPPIMMLKMTPSILMNLTKFISNIMRSGFVAATKYNLFTKREIKQLIKINKKQSKLLI